MLKNVNHSKIGNKILRWAGSKTQSEKHIVPYLDFRKIYVEPFCGSASFFFSQIPDKACLNDSNPNLIRFFKDLSCEPVRVWEIYDQLPTEKDDYYRIRSNYNSLELGEQKSAHFLYLNHYCFNGIYRVNKSGEFNTPFGKHGQKKSKLSLAELMYFSDISRRAEFYCKDFEEFLSDLRPNGCEIFMDPPYFTNDSRVFGEYGALPFGADDLRRLRSVFDQYSSTNTIVITYKDCSEFRDLFGEFIQSEVAITRNVGGFSGRRKRDVELIAVSSTI